MGSERREGKEKSRHTLFVGIGVAALLLWSFVGSEADPRALFGAQGRAGMLGYISRLFPPDLSAGLVRGALWGAVETVAISFLGTVMAVAIGLPLAIAASSTLTHEGLLYEMEGRRWIRLGAAAYIGARGVLTLLRTVPDLVWAVIFVFAVGLGPFPGVLALGLHTGGVLGRLYAEVLEEVNPQPVEALQSTGAGRLQIVLYSLLPQALPQCLSYTLYRWEVNIRAAAILGFVGAGGLGQQIYVAISLFHDHQLLTLLIVLYILVTAVDLFSATLRRRLA